MHAPNGEHSLQALRVETNDLFLVAFIGSAFSHYADFLRISCDGNLSRAFHFHTGLITVE